MGQAGSITSAHILWAGTRAQATRNSRGSWEVLCGWAGVGGGEGWGGASWGGQLNMVPNGGLKEFSFSCFFPSFFSLSCSAPASL